jgi:hypothetical protein
MAAHQQTFENVQLLQSAEIPPMALGDFKLAAGKPAIMNKALSIRADNLKPPTGATFSQHLRQTFEAELTGAGKLNPAAPIVVSGELTRSEVVTNPPTGRAEVGARFKAVRSGVTVFDRELVVSEEWPSGFFGVEAIPEAMNHYNGLYAKLVTKLLSDPEFRQAIKTP